MPTLELTIDIRAEREALFALTQDYDRRLQWDPFLREARLLDGAPAAAVGVRAWCVARYGWGLGMETAYVSLDPPSVVAVKMTRGPAILASFAGSWRFTHNGPGTTRVIFRYNLTTRPRLLHAVLDPLVVAVFARDTRHRLRALKRAVETTAILNAHATS